MDNLIGKTLGKYKIESLVGEGGMAAVYKAYRRDQDRYVALKVLPRHFSENPQFVARFKREARVLSELQHPHVLWVTEFGEAEGYTYMAMPLLTGGSLARRMQLQSLPLDEITRVIKQVGSALDYAHQRNMVHRDMKPGNILIDAAGNYLLADFGIAKLYDATTHLTQQGMQLGTPAYMSPEQIQGLLELDGRSDLYSFGVVLYEMVTGRVPFIAPTAMTIMFMQVSNPPPEPRTLNATIPLALEAVILKALAKRPEDRYANVPEFVAAFEAAVPLAQPLAGVLRDPTSSARRPATQPPMLPHTATPSTHITPPPRQPTPLPPPIVNKPASPVAAIPAQSPAKRWPLIAIGGGLLAVIVVGLICSGLWGMFTATPAPPATLPAPTTVRPSDTARPPSATASVTLIPATAIIATLAPIPTSPPLGLVSALSGTTLSAVQLDKSVRAPTTGLAYQMQLFHGSGLTATLYIAPNDSGLQMAQRLTETFQASLFAGADILLLPGPFVKGGQLTLGTVTAQAVGEKTCLAATLAADGVVTLRCFSGICTYGAATSLPSDKYVVITNGEATAPRSISATDRAAYRALLAPGGARTKADIALCRLNPGAAMTATAVPTATRVPPTNVPPTNVPPTSVPPTDPPPSGPTDTPKPPTDG